MLATQLLLPGLALIGAVAAQTSVCATATATINSQADASAYAKCETLKNVEIGSEIVGDLTIDGPSQISGTFNAENARFLTAIRSPSIGAIGTFTMFNLTTLSTLSFSSLTQVGIINWSALPVLSALTFPATISKASSVTITNTRLGNLDGINLKTVGLLDINNNVILNKFETQVANITEGINIAGNGKNLDISFPNLIFANNMTFRDVKALSTPSLQSVNGSLIFDNNGFTEYLAPNLTSVGNTATGIGSLAFVGNDITNITFANLISVGGGVQVANNSDLQTVSFPALTTVGGAIDLSGNFTTPDMPALKNVVGALNIQSTAQIDCVYYDGLVGDQVVQGQEACVSATDDPSTLNPDGTTNTSGSGTTSSNNEGAASSFGVSHVVAALSVVGGLLQMVL